MTTGLSLPYRLFAGMLLACAACSCTPRQFNAPGLRPGSSVQLFGGAPAEKGQFPWLVSLQFAGGMCTAAKIGPRAFLTAAHCLADADTGDIRLGFFDGAFPKMRLGIDAHVDVPAFDASTPFTPVAVHLHPSYGAGIVQFLRKDPDSFFRGQGASDVAVVIVKEDSPKIPIARIADTVPLAGSKVIVAGFGCESGLADFVKADAEKKAPSGRLKFQKTELLPATDAVHEGSPVVDAASFASRTLLTAGGAMNPTEASLCPGDSGGPVFLAETGTIVGVNANYTFFPLTKDPTRTPYTNVYSRVDKGANPVEGKGVGVWIQDALSGTVTPLAASAARLAYLTSQRLPTDGSALQGAAPRIGETRAFVFLAYEAGKGQFTYELENANGLSFSVQPNTRAVAEGRSAKWESTDASGKLKARRMQEQDSGLAWVFIRNDDAVEGTPFTLRARMTLPMTKPTVGARSVWTAACGPLAGASASVCYEMSFDGMNAVSATYRAFLNTVCGHSNLPIVENATCVVPLGTPGCRNTLASPAPGDASPSGDSKANSVFLTTWYAGYAKDTIAASCVAPQTFQEK